MAITENELPLVELSVVVVAFNIPRELPRTLLSLSVGYQRGVRAEDYEVIVVDNGSSPPIDPSIFADLEGQFRLIRIDDASPSPAHAANVGLAQAQGRTIGIMIDGARIVSPGLLHFVLAGSRISGRSAIATLGWYLGYDFQQNALQAGWSQADEDRLLEGIDWPNDGYRLFEIATMDESSVNGWFEPIFESNALFLSDDAWKELGGIDERFDAAGGGLVNHDTFRRAADLNGVEWVILLGEGTFHQAHGGIATNAPIAQFADLMGSWSAQYEDIREHGYEVVELRAPVFIGTLPPALLPRYAYGLNTLLYKEGVVGSPIVPPAALPDPASERNPIAARWLELATLAAQRGNPIEAMSFARWGREVAADVDSAGALLAYVGAVASVDLLAPAEIARFHAETGLVLVAAEDLHQAGAHFAEALRIDPGNSLARDAMCKMAMPGDNYQEVLRWIHEAQEPPTYLEIGVDNGGSLALAKPPTIAVGVDPVPAINQPISVEHHVFPLTSNEFFERHDLHSLIGGPPSMVFIDGLHTFPAVLEDFWRVEAISGPNTLVALHDTIPLDEITQRPERVYNFYTGDVWKLLHCLAEVRPDLSWATVRTPPSGLTLVTGLDATSTVLRDRYDELIERYGSLTFEDAAVHPGPFIDNQQEAVTEWLSDWRAKAPRASLGNTAPTLVGIQAALAERDLAMMELQAIYQTKLLRWSSGLRHVYGKVRR